MSFHPSGDKYKDALEMCCYLYGKNSHGDYHGQGSFYDDVVGWYYDEDMTEEAAKEQLGKINPWQTTRKSIDTFVKEVEDEWYR